MRRVATRRAATRHSIVVISCHPPRAPHVTRTRSRSTIRRRVGHRPDAAARARRPRCRARHAQLTPRHRLLRRARAQDWPASGATPTRHTATCRATRRAAVRRAATAATRRHTTAASRSTANAAASRCIAAPANAAAAARRSIAAAAHVAADANAARRASARRKDHRRKDHRRRRGARLPRRSRHRPCNVQPPSIAARRRAKRRQPAHARLTRRVRRLAGQVQPLPRHRLLWRDAGHARRPRRRARQAQLPPRRCLLRCARAHDASRPTRRAATRATRRARRAR